MDAGKLDRSLQLLTRTTTRSPTGQPIDVWTASGTTQAQRLHLSNVDMARGAGRDTIPEAKYLIRWRSDITPTTRVVVDGQTFSIIAIDQPDRRQTLILTLRGV